MVTTEEEDKEDKPRLSSRKYSYPDCGSIIRWTKAISVICGDYMVEFEKEKWICFK